MKQNVRKVLAAVCALTVVASSLGVSAYADENANVTSVSVDGIANDTQASGEEAAADEEDGLVAGDVEELPTLGGEAILDGDLLPGNNQGFSNSSMWADPNGVIIVRYKAAADTNNAITFNATYNWTDTSGETPVEKNGESVTASISLNKSENLTDRTIKISDIIKAIEAKAKTDNKWNSMTVKNLSISNVGFTSEDTEAKITAVNYIKSVGGPKASDYTSSYFTVLQSASGNSWEAAMDDTILKDSTGKINIEYSTPIDSYITVGAKLTQPDDPSTTETDESLNSTIVTVDYALAAAETSKSFAISDIVKDLKDKAGDGYKGDVTFDNLRVKAPFGFVDLYSVQYEFTRESNDYFTYDPATKKWTATSEAFRNKYRSIVVTYDNALSAADQELISIDINGTVKEYRADWGTHDTFTITLDTLLKDFDLTSADDIEACTITLKGDTGSVSIVDIQNNLWGSNAKVDENGILTWDNFPLPLDKDAEKDTVAIRYRIYVNGSNMDTVDVKYTNDKGDSRTLSDPSFDLLAALEYYYSNNGSLIQESDSVQISAYNVEYSEDGKVQQGELLGTDYISYSEFFGLNYKSDIKKPAVSASDVKITEEKDGDDKSTGNYDVTISVTADNSVRGYIYQFGDEEGIAEVKDGKITVEGKLYGTSDTKEFKIFAFDARGDFGLWSDTIRISPKKDDDEKFVEYNAEAIENKGVYIENVPAKAATGTEPAVEAHDVLHVPYVPYAAGLCFRITDEDGNENYSYSFYYDLEDEVGGYNLELKDLLNGKPSGKYTIEWLGRRSNGTNGYNVIGSEEYTKAFDSSVDATEWDAGFKLNDNGTISFNNVPVTASGKVQQNSYSPSDEFYCTYYIKVTDSEGAQKVSNSQTVRWTTDKNGNNDYIKNDDESYKKSLDSPKDFDILENAMDNNWDAGTYTVTVTTNITGYDKDSKQIDKIFEASTEYEYKALEEDSSVAAPAKIKYTVEKDEDSNVIRKYLIDKTAKAARFGISVNGSSESYYAANKDGETSISAGTPGYNVKVRTIDANGAVSSYLTKVSFENEWASDLKCDNGVLTWNNVKLTGADEDDYVEYRVRVYSENRPAGVLLDDPIKVMANDTETSSKLDLRFALAKLSLKSPNVWNSLRGADKSANLTVKVIPVDSNDGYYDYGEISYDYTAERDITTTYDIEDITLSYYKYYSKRDGTVYDEVITFKPLENAIGYIVEYYDGYSSNKYVVTEKPSVVLTKLKSYTTDFSICAVYADGTISSEYSYLNSNSNKYNVKLDTSKAQVKWNKVTDAKSYYVDVFDGKGDYVTTYNIEDAAKAHEGSKAVFNIPKNELKNYWFTFNVYAENEDGEYELLGNTEEAYVPGQYRTFDPNFSFDSNNGILSVQPIEITPDYEITGSGTVATYTFKTTTYDKDGNVLSFSSNTHHDNYQIDTVDKYWQERMGVSEGANRIDLYDSLSIPCSVIFDDEDEKIDHLKVEVEAENNENDKHYYGSSVFEYTIPGGKLDTNIKVTAEADDPDAYIWNLKFSDDVIGYVSIGYKESDAKKKNFDKKDFYKGFYLRSNDVFYPNNSSDENDKWIYEIIPVDADLNYGEAFKITGGVNTDIKLLPDKTWESEVNYDEETGCISWKEITDADFDGDYYVKIIDPKYNSVVKEFFAPVNIFQFGTYAGIFCNDTLERGKTYEVKIVARDPNETYTEETNYYSEDSTFFTYMGGILDTEIVVPEAEKAFRYEDDTNRYYRVELAESDTTFGYKFELIGTDENVTVYLDNSWTFQLLKKDSAQTYNRIRVTAYDKDGNYSKPVTYELKDSIPAEYDYSYKVEAATTDGVPVEDIGGKFDTLADALNVIKNDKAGYDYTLTINDATPVSAVAITGKANSVTIRSDLNKSIVLTGSSFSAAVDTVIECDVIQASGKNVVFNANNSTIEFKKSISGVVTLKGNEVIVDDGVTVNAKTINLKKLSSFGKTVVASEGTAKITDTLEGIIEFKANPKTALKSTIAKISWSKILLPESGVLPSVTVNNIEDSVEVQVVDESGTLSKTISSGDVLFYTAKDFSDKIRIKNSDYKYVASFSNKAVSAVASNAFELGVGDTVTEYKDYESLLSAINSDKEAASKDYVITVNDNISVNNFKLPTKAKSLRIVGNGNVAINAKNVATLKANYDFEVRDIVINSLQKNGKIAVNTGKYTFTVVNGGFTAQKGVTYIGSKGGTLGVGGDELGNSLGVTAVSGYSTVDLACDFNVETKFSVPSGTVNLYIDGEFGDLLVKIPTTLTLGSKCAVSIGTLNVIDKSEISFTKQGAKAIAIGTLNVENGGKLKLTSDFRYANTAKKVSIVKVGKGVDIADIDVSELAVSGYTAELDAKGALKISK